MPVHRLVAALTTGVVGALALSGWVVGRHMLATFEADRAHELGAVARQVRAVAMALGPELGSRRAAAAASEGLEAAYSGRWRWLVLRPDGADLDPALHALGPDGLARLADGEARTRVADERLSLLLALPPDHDGSRLVLELSESLAELRAAEGEALRGLVLGMLGAACLAGLSSALVGHLLVARPLQRLTGFVRGVEAGDLSMRLPARGRGGLVGLEQALNALCARLQAAERSLRESAVAAEQAAEGLRRADRLASVGKLAAGLAHELGTPLNTILLRARALERDAAEPAEVARQAGIVAGQAERLIKIVRQLLDFSRRRPPHLTSLDPAELCRNVAALLGPQARAAEVALRVEAPADLPRLRADAAQLEQAVTNLIVNAIHASPGGAEVALRCAVVQVLPPADLDRPGCPPARDAAPVRALRLEVSDQGAGVAREHVPLLFDPFFTTKPPGEGTGLGLPVAWGIVREHGGWIAVETRECEGSRFSILLPLEGGPGGQT